MAERGQEPEPRSDYDLPEAKTARRWNFSWFWIVPLAALGFVAWLIIHNYLQKGPTVTLTFKDGRGIEAGKSQLKFRGVKIGEVRRIEVAKDLQSVRIRIRLDRSVEDVARAQSQFWIVEPEVTADRIRGLRTIMSGVFIEVKPGAGTRTNEFVGLEEAPLLAHHLPGLEIVLLREELGAIQKGTPIFYRGEQVGQVTEHHLDTNALSVRISAHIEKQYAPLVHENTRFWNAGGIHFKLGLLGAKIQANSFESLISGGIEFNTPPAGGPPAKDGDLFRLYDKPEDEWQKWGSPTPISPGQSTAPAGRTEQRPETSRRK